MKGAGRSYENTLSLRADNEVGSGVVEKWSTRAGNRREKLGTTSTEALP